MIHIKIILTHEESSLYCHSLLWVATESELLTGDMTNGK